MKHLLNLSILLLILLTSCSHTITTSISNPYPPLEVNDNISIIGLNEKYPDNYALVGKLKLGDSGFSTDCDYYTAMSIAKEEARKSGGNAVKVTSEIQPSIFGSSCYRMTGDILKIDETNTPQASTPDSTRIDAAQLTLSNNNTTTKSSGSSKGARFSINTGYSYRTASVIDLEQAELEDYIKQLKSGFHIGADFVYFFNDSYGLGCKYAFFKSSNSMDDVYIDLNDGNGLQYGSISDDIYMSFFGPTFSSRLKLLNTHSLITNISLGYLSYNDDSQAIDYKFMIKGSTFGSAFDLGYEIPISENASLGLMLSYFLGTLTQYEISDGTQSEIITLEKGQYESLNRLDISVTLTFGK